MAQPFVSIIVPVRNEERYIERCLHSIARQDYPRGRFEVLVVDGESTDLTRQIVNRFAAEYAVDLRLLANPVRKTAAGVNIGLRAARGDVIIRIDGHAAMTPDFLSLGTDALLATGADCVGGAIESEGEGYAGRAIALAMSSPFGAGGAAFRSGGEGDTDTVAFGAYRRDVFDRIGQFTEDIDKGEDDEFNYRLRGRGGRILLVPGMRARYTVRAGFPALWRQYFGYGRAKPEVLRRHPAQTRARQFAPAALVAGGAISAAAAMAGHAAPFKLLVSSYGAAIAIASVAVSRRRGVRFLPALPVAFACLHISYGVGFIAGLLGLAARATRRGVGEVTEQGTQAPT